MKHFPETFLETQCLNIVGISHFLSDAIEESSPPKMSLPGL